MNMLLAGAGMVACLALIMVVIPLGRKLIGRAGSHADESRDPGGQEDP
jgi:hypothetical protein